MIPPFYIAVVMLLWTLPLLAWAVPRIVDAQRDAIRAMSGATFVFMLLLVAAFTLSVGRAIADKGGEGGGGGETNTPPVACRGEVSVINLVERGTGRLVPVSTPIKELP